MPRGIGSGQTTVIPPRPVGRLLFDKVHRELYLTLLDPSPSPPTGFAPLATLSPEGEGSVEQNRIATRFCNYR